MEPQRQRGQRREEARWFVRAQGATLGPFRAPDILTHVRSGDILPTDSIFTSRDKAWTVLEEHPYFASFEELVDRPRASDLVAMPSPRMLRIKHVSAIPPTPKVEAEAQAAADAPAEISVAASELVPEPVALAVAEPVPVPAPEAVTASNIYDFGYTASASALPEFLPEVMVSAEPIVSTVFAAPAEVVTVSAPEPVSAAPIETTKAPVQEPPYLMESPSPFPARPDFRPVFLSDPGIWDPPMAKPEKARTISIELKLPDRPLKAALILLLIVGAAAGGGYALKDKKTRDLKDSHLSDPSSPTLQPQEPGDPVPVLKAPTRPQRE